MTQIDEARERKRFDAWAKAYAWTYEPPSTIAWDAWRARAAAPAAEPALVQAGSIGRCATCAHWDSENYYAHPAVRRCRAVPMFWNSTTWNDEGERVWVSEPARIPTTAFAQDGSDYSACLLTVAEHGCTMHAPRAEGGVMSIAYDPTPRLRWLKCFTNVPVTLPSRPGLGSFDYEGTFRPKLVLQYGLRRINGGQWDWFDVPTEQEEPKP